ncbi:MAG: YbhB/YbcL family Raf kinase inhibitor-like protein [Candidatus Omnitrophica bacterium]|nr:YbhB/YbcL family Raf kinase inhibitor-like protein [Candidatus Omnitrophota bacterium]
MRYFLLFLIFSSFFFQSAFALKLETSSFENDKNMPEKYTCLGNDLSPNLSWSEAPEGVQSFVLFCEDPDATFGTWVHWALYNIPKTSSSVKEGLPKVSDLQESMAQGMNDFGKVGYNGPCPPPGKPHRYVFTLYALDTTISVVTRSVTRTDITQAMRGHVLAEARITGKFETTKENPPPKINRTSY